MTSDLRLIVTAWAFRAFPGVLLSQTVGFAVWRIWLGTGPCSSSRFVLESREGCLGLPNRDMAPGGREGLSPVVEEDTRAPLESRVRSDAAQTGK